MRLAKALSLLFYAAALGFVAWMIWGAIAYAGLYRIVQDWQVASFGGSVPGLALIGPITAVAVPLWFLGSLADDSLAPDRQPAEASGRTNSKGLGCMGLVGLTAAVLLAVGGSALVRAVGRPTLDDPLQQVDLAALGDAAPPVGHVRLKGVADNEHMISLVSKGRAGRYEDSFTPIVPTPTNNTGTTIRFFASGHRIDPAGPPPAMSDDPEGLLTANALPPDVRAAFERAGLKIADTAYVLDRNGVDTVVSDYTTAILSLLGGLVLLWGFIAGMRSPGPKAAP